MKKIITLLTLNTIMNLSAQQMHPVQYTRNDGISIAANVYTPAGYIARGAFVVQIGS